MSIGISLSPSRPARSRLAWAALIGAVLAAPGATRADYVISTVAVGNVPHQVPAINNLGQVSFIGGGGVVSVWDGTSVSAVPTGGLGGFTDNTAINDAGVVAFTNRSGIYTSSVGGTLATVADRTTLPAGTIFDSPAINDAGTVAFTAGVYPFGITGAITLYRWSGSGAPTSLGALGTYDLGEQKPRPAINDAGTIAITGRGIGGARSGVYLASDSGLTPVATSTGFSTDFGDASLNASGQLVVSYASLSGPAQLLTGTAAPLQVYGSSATSPFATFQDETGYSNGHASINDAGQIAFLGYVKPYNGSASGGIFTGLDTVRDRVVMAGDPLAGSTIKQLDFGPFGLNNSGQIAFWAALNDGRTGIFVVTAVPEPTSTALLATGLLTLAAARRIRRGREKG